ncbi:hypothetical protein Pla163_20900 [Planctomycetes bacterium Pla163]|uniref:Uncharacterized protein n=1 Tax=Rohdeia mirabilis TaxID=2528008 RepID=A0A518D0H4_9BACT|nr:hypothetical protein Pla163_20900 [Planctomycetes bacterium Pla163]
MNEPERPLSPDELRELETELARLRPGASERGDPLAANVAALRRLDAASPEVVERALDASLDAYADSSTSVGPLDFFVARLRLSPALRVVAACLVAHVLVLPVLAYQVLVPAPSEPAYRIEFMLPSDQPLLLEMEDDLRQMDARSLLDEEHAPHAEGSADDANVDEDGH